MGLSVTKLILIRWIIWEALLKFKDSVRLLSARLRAHVSDCTFFVGIINCPTGLRLHSLVLLGRDAEWKCLPQTKTKSTSHICETFVKAIADLLWTMPLKHPRSWPVLKTLSCSGVRKHLLDPQREWGGVGLELWWKDKKMCMKTSSPKTAGKLPEWGLRFKFHLCDEQMRT